MSLVKLATPGAGFAALERLGLASKVLANPKNAEWLKNGVKKTPSIVNGISSISGLPIKPVLAPITKIANFATIKESNKGLLHQYFNIPEDQKIPTELLQQKLESTDDPILKKRLTFAINARKWKHK